MGTFALVAPPVNAAIAQEEQMYKTPQSSIPAFGPRELYLAKKDFAGVPECCMLITCILLRKSGLVWRSSRQASLPGPHPAAISVKVTVFVG